jgi:SAM-dependent methyltransferase
MNRETQDPDSASARFGADYYQRVYDINGVSPWDIHWWANRYYAKLVERLLRRVGGHRFLDVGCGQGFTLARLGDQVEAWGIDVSDYAVSRCAIHAPRARVIVGNIEAEVPQGLPEGGFDVVLARYILEHLHDPASAMSRCASLLRPGGYLLYSVPNMESPGRRMKGKQWFGYLDETHCSLLEPAEWLHLTREAGLEAETVFSDGLWDVPYIRRIPRLLQYPIFSIPTVLAVLFASTALPLSMGENLIVFARKPR